MVLRYKADGLCPSTLDTVPKPAGTIVHLFTQSFNPMPSSVGSVLGASRGAWLWDDEEGKRYHFDLDLNPDLESSFLYLGNSETERKKKHGLGYM